MKTRREPLLLLLDVLNITWMSAILLQAYRGQTNNIANPWVVAPVLACVLLHSVRWQKLAKLPYEGTCSNLADALNGAARAFLGRFPYLASTMPSKALVQSAADRHAASSSASACYTYGDLFRILVRVRDLRAVNAAIVPLCIGALTVGATPSYTPSIFHWWPISGAIVVVITGVGINSSSMLIFLLVRRLWAPCKDVPSPT